MDWKSRINARLQPKTPQERQRMMKYVIVMPGAILCGVVVIWLLYSGLYPDEKSGGDVFRTDMPAGEKGEIGNKMQEYEAAEAAEEKEMSSVIINSMDSLSMTSADTVSQPSAIEASARQFQEVQQSLNDFYVPDDTPQQTDMSELQSRIDELEAQTALAQQQSSQSNDLEMLERSYQLAAQYMGTGGNPSAPSVISRQPQENERGKRDVEPVTQVRNNVVSTLSASASGRGFHTSVGSKATVSKNTIAAVVAGNQSVLDGECVRLRLSEPMWIGSRMAPHNTLVTGVARIQGDRMEIVISSVAVSGSIYEVELSVFDSDGQEGINIPGSMENEALHEIGANMGSAVGSSINISTNTGAQITSDLGRGLLNGVSQYLSKKSRTIKVHLKAGYRVMLRQPED